MYWREKSDQVQRGEVPPQRWLWETERRWASDSDAEKDKLFHEK